MQVVHVNRIRLHSYYYSYYKLIQTNNVFLEKKQKKQIIQVININKILWVTINIYINVFNIICVVMSSFLVVEGGLAWKVGNWGNLRNVVDLWVGFRENLCLPRDLVTFSNDSRRITLDSRQYTFYHLGLRLGKWLPTQPSDYLCRFMARLYCCFELVSCEDQRHGRLFLLGLFLVWGYTPKTDYLYLANPRMSVDLVWWLKKIWKLSCPAKA